MCSKPLVSPVRFCKKCKKPILSGHKYKITRTGLQHRHCDYPDAYLTPREYQKKYGHAPY
jgi:hypothetical protein